MPVPSDGEIWITDLGVARPESALSTTRAKGRWKLLPYALQDQEGRMLSALGGDNPPPVRVPLPEGGPCAAHIGMWSERSLGVKVRFDGNPYGRILAPTDKAPKTPGELLVSGINLNSTSIEDLPLGPVPRGARYLEILPVGKPRSYGGHVAYLRLVPISASAEAVSGEPRPLLASADGNSFLASWGGDTVEEIREEIEIFRGSDFRAVHWCIFGADLTSYPTRVGTMAGGEVLSFPGPEDERIAVGNRALADKGICPLRVAREWAREIGIQFHISQRTQCFSLQPPYEDYLSSGFFASHPHWRCVDRDGTVTAQMSYAYEEVRKHLVDVLVEAVELAGSVDGINLIGVRGGPLALFEQPVLDGYDRANGVAEEENEQFLRHRARFFTEYLRALRGALKVPLSVTVYADRRSNLLYGMDPEAWAREALVELLVAYPIGYTDLCHTFGTPVEAPWFNRLASEYGIPWYTLPSPKGSELRDLVLAAREAYQAGAHGLYFWDAAGWMASRPATWEVERKLGHRDWVMSVPEDQLPQQRWERMRKLGEFSFARHASWMGF